MIPNLYAGNITRAQRNCVLHNYYIHDYVMLIEEIIIFYIIIMARNVYKFYLLASVISR